MNHLTVPLIFLLYFIAGWALADPGEEYMSYDYESEEFVLVEPQSTESAIIYDDDMNASLEIVVDQTPDEVWVVNPDNISEIKMYEKN